MPATAANRLQRYAVTLTGYNFDIKYISTNKNSNVDCLSRLPLKMKEDDQMTEDNLYLNFFETQVPIKCKDIKIETQRDPILCKVLRYVMHGWPNGNSDSNLTPYFVKRNEISIEQGCLLWSYKVIIPLKFRSHLLNELHSSHLVIFLHF